MSAQAVVKVTGNDFSRVPTDLFIGGKWVPGAEGKRIDVVDPSTEKRIASVANATVADAIKAVDAAYQAGAAWAATAPRVRGEILRKTFELMVARADWYAELITLEMGKALGATPRARSLYAAEFLRWFSEEAVRIHGDLIGTAPAGATRGS